MSTFYDAPNDYRNYLCHYGVKGMKWRKGKKSIYEHRRQQMNKNFHLPGHDDDEQMSSRRRHEFSRENTHGDHEFSRENTHKPTLLDERNNREDTRHTNGVGPSQTFSTASRRRHDLTWDRTHNGDTNISSVVGHIPRSYHSGENYEAARTNLNKKRKTKR